MNYRAYMWEKRFFELQNLTFSYKKSEESIEWRNSFRIDHTFEIKDAGTDSRNRKIFVLLKSGISILNLRAPENEANEWMECIRSHIKYASYLFNPQKDLDASPNPAENSQLLNHKRDLSRKGSVGHIAVEKIQTLFDWPGESISSEVNKKKWKLYKIDNGLRFYREKGESSGAIKVVGSVNVVPEDVFFALMDLGKSRNDWDLSFDSGKVMSSDDRHTDQINITFNKLPGAFLMQQRDVCCSRYWRREENESYVIAIVSEEQETLARSKKKVRADIQCMVYLICPLVSGTGSRITMLLQMSTNGWLGCFKSYSFSYHEYIVKSMGGLRDYLQQRTDEDLTKELTTWDDLPKSNNQTPANKASMMAQNISIPSDKSAYNHYDTTLPNVTNYVENEGGYWDLGDATTFDVRGANYMEDKLKIPSPASVCHFVGVDILQDSERIEHVASIPGTLMDLAKKRGDNTFKLVFSIQIPGPPHYIFTSYISIPEPLNVSPAVAKLIEAFINGDDEFRNKRFKMIPRIVEGPWIVKKSVGSQPALLGTKLPTIHFMGEHYLEICFDVAVNSVATGITKMAMGYAKSLVVDIAFLIQGEDEDELPEQILGVVRLGDIDLSKSKHVVDLKAASSSSSVFNFDNKDKDKRLSGGTSSKSGKATSHAHFENHVENKKTI